MESKMSDRHDSASKATALREAGDAFRAGHLPEAIAAAGAAVKARPGDLPARILLAEMLLFAGNLERADVVLDAASAVDPSAALVVAEFRQLLRAEMARRQLYRDGRVPELLGEPDALIQGLLATMVALRAGDKPAARGHADAAEATRRRAAGLADDTAFDDFRDASDTLSGVLEVLTTTGKYFWISIAKVLEMTFHKPARPRDLAWRRVSLSVAGGPEGDVYMPAIYVSDDPDLEPSFRLGRMTDWSDDEGPVTGIGQRVFLMGETAMPVMELDHLVFGR
jgi:type VI secretion system protein ImpE